MSSFGDAVESYEKQLRDWLSKCPACVLSPQVMLHARRGTAMVQVGQSFEFDERLHARDNPPNHILARQLVQYNGKIKNPIIFWLNSSFPSDSIYQLHKQPVVHHVLRLGAGYTFTSVLVGLKTALKAEKINADSLEWDPKKLKLTLRELRYSILRRGLDVNDRVSPSDENVYNNNPLFFVRIHIAMNQARRNMKEIPLPNINGTSTFRTIF